MRADVLRILRRVRPLPPDNGGSWEAAVVTLDEEVRLLQTTVRALQETLERETRFKEMWDATNKPSPEPGRRR